MQGGRILEGGDSLRFRGISNVCKSCHAERGDNVGQRTVRRNLFIDAGQVLIVTFSKAGLIEDVVGEEVTSSLLLWRDTEGVCDDMTGRIRQGELERAARRIRRKIIRLRRSGRRGEFARTRLDNVKFRRSVLALIAKHEIGVISVSQALTPCSPALAASWPREIALR